MDRITEPDPLEFNCQNVNAKTLIEMNIFFICKKKICVKFECIQL